MARRICPVPGCPRITTGGRCPEHRATLDHTRGTATQRGYDRQHQRLRTKLLPAAIGQPCPRCGQPMLADQALDLGHSTDRALDPTARADRIEHAHCNRSAGGRLAHDLGT